MPKPLLKPEFTSVAAEVITTMLGGLHEWRPDLNYPESHSDMQAGVMALLRKYDMKLRPVPLDRSELEARDACPRGKLPEGARRRDVFRAFGAD